jgi:hypothetical protein
MNEFGEKNNIQWFMFPESNNTTVDTNNVNVLQKWQKELCSSYAKRWCIITESQRE